MWFNQLMFFSYSEALSKDLDELHQQLQAYQLKPCPPHAKSTIGFDVIFNQEPDLLMHTVNACHVATLTERQRLLPSSVLKAALEEKKLAYEVEHQRSMPRSDLLQTKEMLEFELLPKAFTVDKKRWFYIDTQQQWVVINTAIDSVGSDIIAHLIKSLGGHGFLPFDIDLSLPALMQHWLRNPAKLSHGYKLGHECQLVRSPEDKTSYQCKDIETHHDSVCELLDQGFQIKSLALEWEDKLQLTLMDNGVFKKVKCLDVLTEDLKEHKSLESHWEKFDADMAMLTGEVRLLMSDFSKLVESIDIDTDNSNAQDSTKLTEEAAA